MFCFRKSRINENGGKTIETVSLVTRKSLLCLAFLGYLETEITPVTRFILVSRLPRTQARSSGLESDWSDYRFRARYPCSIARYYRLQSRFPFPKHTRNEADPWAYFNIPASYASRVTWSEQAFLSDRMVYYPNTQWPMVLFQVGAQHPNCFGKNELKQISKELTANSRRNSPP